MKKLFYILSLALFVVSCAGNGTTKTTAAATTTKAQTEEQQAPRYLIDSLLANAQTLADKEVTVEGTITHTCKFSGRRCFMVASDQKTTLRIEAKGEISGFNRELIGSTIAVKGKLRENRLTKEYLDRWEEQIKESQGKEDGSAESCGAETGSINSIREWMKKNNKDYYSVYFMDGESYTVVE